MKNLKLLFLVLVLSMCKKNTFADNIVLVDDSGIEMKFQNFNEGLAEYGSSLIYVGEIKDSIPVKYYESMFPPLPPPNFYLKTQREKKDSAVFNQMRRKYFHDDFERIQFSNKVVSFDSLTYDKLEVIVKPKDTIRHFALDSVGKIKAYKSFPVFVRNISGKKLIMPEMKSLATFILNKNNKWQLIWNDNGSECGYSMYNRRYWILNPGEMVVFSMNYFHGTEKTKFKVALSHSFFSKEFEGFISPEIFKKQRIIYEVK